MQPKVNTDLNMNTLIVYHILYGLQPLLGQTGSGEGTGKVVGHAKLSVPVGELLLCAVECLQVLCEDVANGEVCVWVLGVCACGCHFIFVGLGEYRVCVCREGGSTYDDPSSTNVFVDAGCVLKE